jgi:hypothetical protein
MGRPRIIEFLTGNPSGYCKCGCGRKTNIARQTLSEKNHLKGIPVHFIMGHGPTKNRQSWQHGRVILRMPDHPRASCEGAVFRSLIVAEKALGRPIPINHPIHHANENRADDTNSNLVICQDVSYHALLHKRTRALKACGNPTWRKCNICKQYDDPQKLHFSHNGTSVYHPKCRNLYNRELKGRRRYERLQSATSTCDL